MTAIVGVEDRGNIVIGGDAAFTDERNLGLTKLSTPKVWVNGDWIFGSCGSWRIHQLLRYSMVLPQAPESGADEEEMTDFMVTDFMDVVRETLLGSGTVRNRHEVEYVADHSDFMVGVHGWLFLVLEDFSVVHSSTGYAATGCGIDLALGSLHSTRTPLMAPKKRVQKALEAAAEHNAGVAPPFTILSV